MVDFALTDLNVVVTFAMDAMFAEFDFVGKDKSGVDDVVDFLAIAMVCDSVADYLDICVAKRAIVAIKGPQETAGDNVRRFWRDSFRRKSFRNRARGQQYLQV